MRDIKSVVVELVVAFNNYMDQLDAQGSMHCDEEQSQLELLFVELARDHGLPDSVFKAYAAKRKAVRQVYSDEAQKLDGLTWDQYQPLAKILWAECKAKLAATHWEGEGL